MKWEATKAAGHKLRAGIAAPTSVSSAHEIEPRSRVTTYGNGAYQNQTAIVLFGIGPTSPTARSRPVL